MKKAARILVGLKTKDQALELTDLACRVAARSANLLLVHVIELPDVTPLDAELPEAEADARGMLNAGARLARRSGRNVRTLIVRAHSAGRALVEIMVEQDIDLAILGSHHARTMGELLFGTTHHFLAKHAPCRTLVSIPASAAVRKAAAA